MRSERIDEILDDALCATFPASDPVALTSYHDPLNASKMVSAKYITVPTESVVLVTWNELPLCCPRLEQTLWSSHPRVYLPIQESGRERCPYCGTVYVLKVADSGDHIDPNLQLE